MSSPATIRYKIFFRVLLLLFAVLLCFLIGEASIRILDKYKSKGRALFKGFEAKARLEIAYADYVKGFPGVERSWFMIDPSPLERSTTDAELQAHYDSFLKKEGVNPWWAFCSLKIWNINFVKNDYNNNWRWFKNFLGPEDSLLIFEPPEQTIYPRFRFIASQTLPAGLVTNNFGWRGKDISLNKPNRTIRIAFIGASTTVNSHGFQFSYPEYIGHWLNMWASSKNLDIKFEIINAGREAINSQDMAAIVRWELLPVEPDLVVFYAGANQFRFLDILKLPEGVQFAEPPDTLKPQEPSGIFKYSALARRLKLARNYLYNTGKLGSVLDVLASDEDSWKLMEPAKPAYELLWPGDLDESDPDLDSPNIPVNLRDILNDLEAIEKYVESIKADFIVSSFIWLVNDGLLLDPEEHFWISSCLNKGMWPMTYADMRRLMDFFNRAYAKFAANHGSDFIDIDALFPRDPMLFSDCVHRRPVGLMLHGWLAAKELLPIIERKITSGELPRQDQRVQERHPYLPTPLKWLKVNELKSQGSS